MSLSDKDQKLYDRRCPVCQSYLWIGLGPKAIYCSDTCKDRAYRARKQGSKSPAI